MNKHEPRKYSQRSVHFQCILRWELFKLYMIILKNERVTRY